MKKLGGGEPFLIGADEEREILGHEARFDGTNCDFLQGGGKTRQLGIRIELGAVR